MNVRDKTVDRLRGLAMFWVIVVHVLYWGGFFSNEFINTIKSFCLFEMPLFFFVTGAGASFSKVGGYCRFVLKRYKKVLIPYWPFACICAILSVNALKASSEIGIFDFIKILLSWLIPIDRQITPLTYLTSALWFIPVYLCVVLILPFLKEMRQGKMAIPFLWALLVLFCISCVKNIGWAQNVVFYSLWTYIGLFYCDIMLRLQQKNFHKYMMAVVLSGVVLMAFFYKAGKTIDMQYNKFPPNLMFGAFSAVMMAFVILAIPYINKAYDYIEKLKVTKEIANLFSMRSMTIFLYQVFAFSISKQICNALLHGDSAIVGVQKAILCLFITVPVCACFALILGRIENIGNK